MEIAIGIDLGGTRTKIGLVKDGEIIASDKVMANPGGSLLAHLSDAAAVVARAMAAKGIVQSDLAGVGIAFPGIVDSDRMKILSKYVKYTDAGSLDLKRWAKDLWDLPLTLENDARAALVGEWQYGAGKGYNNVVLVTLGTGVGTGVLIDGKLFKGKNYLAGNLGGHMTINLNGRICNCGGIGCLETEASTWALQENIKRAGLEDSPLATGTGTDYHALFYHAGQGDPLARRIRDQSLKAWSLGVINLVHAYDPERIIIGGGIMKSKDEILPAIEEMVNRHAWIPEGSTAIVPATQVEYAGILGISYLVNNNRKKNDGFKL